MKEIMKKLQQNGTVFTINGIVDYNNIPKVFKIKVDHYEGGRTITSVEETKLFGRGMNVKKFTTTSMHLYDFNMFGQRTSFKIKYKDVVIIEE